jgi:hypothetical protein
MEKVAEQGLHHDVEDWVAKSLVEVQEAEAYSDFRGQHGDGCVYRETSFEGD